MFVDLRPRLVGSVLALITLCLTAGAIAESHAASPFTIVPPGPVLSGTSLELRLALENDRDEAIDLQVRFSLQSEGRDETIDEQILRIPARSKKLARSWYSADVAPGEYRIGYEVAWPNEVKRGEWPIGIVPGEGVAIPKLQGMWIEPLAILQGAIDQKPETLRAVVRDSVKTMDEVGVQVLILAYVEYLGHFFYPSDIEFYDEDIQRVSKGTDCVFDLVGAFLTEAEARGMHVILGLGRSGDTQLLWQFDAPDWGDRNRKAIGLASRVADELWERYGKHSSLYGWYLSHEMNDLARASAYYDPIARHCHGLAPEKVVLVAPAGTPIISPAALTASEVDIFAYQDAVGSGYMPNVNTFEPQKRVAVLDGLYKKYASWHRDSQKHIWADLEIWEMDGSMGYGGAYPAAFARVKQQIEVEARYVGMLTGYAYHGYMQSSADESERPVPKARALLRDYKDYLKITPSLDLE